MLWWMSINFLGNNMNKIVKIISSPRKDIKKYEFGGLYKVVVEGSHG